MWFRRVTATGSSDGIDAGGNPDAAVLARSAFEVETNFNTDNFRPTEVFIATWDAVGYHERQNDKVDNSTPRIVYILST